MTTEREQWLALTTEAPLEPHRPICDPHHHLWDRPGWRYLAEDLIWDIAGGHNIVQTVFIESRPGQSAPREMRPAEETEFVVAQGDSTRQGKTRIASGIVGFADLTLGTSVISVLEAHITAGRNRFRGIRHPAAWDASPQITRKFAPRELLLDSKFREGFACLQKYNLSFDAWLYHPQLMELVDLAKTFPETLIILDHMGAPLGIGFYAGKRDEVFREWRRAMTEMATCANVVVKLGGFGLPICGFGWHERAKPPHSTELAEAMAPYCHTCIELFGPERCMFESNFPVDKVSYSYTVLWNAFKRVAENYSPAERAALFHDTAVRTYRLAPDS